MSDLTEPSTWLPDGFVHPERVDLTSGYHLRPIRETDVDIDYPAVMGSRERLWSLYGDAWGWPPETMSYEADREDLARHEREIAAHETFNYAILDADETHLVGCVYIDPHDEHDAEVSWWVVDDLVGSTLELELDAFVPQWLRTTWGFASVYYTLDPAA
ncbi:GNAT family N-acetyltransferase [Agromyces sp. NPDC056523]|uniref:GNAT family N-acetyltransferase n=1 Tax=Agromyces sp. NPDC056523 TaxID=3345850 RepID=UPI00366AAC6E